MHDGDRSGTVQLSILLSSSLCIFTVKSEKRASAQCAEVLPSVSVTGHVLIMPCAALACCIRRTWEAAIRAGVALLIVVVVPAC